MPFPISKCMALEVWNNLHFTGYVMQNKVLVKYVIYYIIFSCPYQSGDEYICNIPPILVGMKWIGFISTNEI